MRIWKTSLDMECDRLRAVADRLMAEDSWFENIGEDSKLDPACGFQKKDIETALETYSEFFLGNRFFQETCDHLHQFFPMDPTWFFFADPVNEILGIFDDIAPSFKQKIFAKAIETSDILNEDHAQFAFYSLKMYAAVYAFRETPVIRDTDIPDYYDRAHLILCAGHFPCGWTRKFKHMSNRWKKGHFIYI
ncbi:MAG: hypothetical protein AAF909_03635 [Pseudomonadota bacterium]